MLTVTTFTGNRILFVEVWTNLVHMDVEELFGYAFGGNNCRNFREIYSGHTDAERVLQDSHR